MTFTSFHKAYLQHTVIVDATLAADCYVNQLVTYNPTTKAIAATDDVNADNAAIIALSDVNFGPLDPNVSVPYAHTPLENKTFAYDGKVAATTGDVTKKVAIWLVKEPLDIVTYQADAPEQLN